MRIILLVAFATATLRAQSAPAHTAPPTREELNAISVRGLMLAAYDRAAWDAGDAIMAVSPDPREIQQYLVVFRPGWPVYFGTLSPARDTFYVYYEAVKRGSDSMYTVSHLPVRDADTGQRLYEVRALTTARAAFGRVTRPYNYAVIPTGTGEWWVYAYPAQTSNNFWPLGGDERFRLSTDGHHILERHRMHVGILEVPLGDVKGPPGYVREGYLHTDVVDNRPEDTDVFGVMARKPRDVERVVTKHWEYLIHTDGRITSPASLDTP